MPNILNNVSGIALDAIKQRRIRHQLIQRYISDNYATNFSRRDVNRWLENFGHGVADNTIRDDFDYLGIVRTTKKLSTGKRVSFYTTIPVSQKMSQATLRGMLPPDVIESEVERVVASMVINPTISPSNVVNLWTDTYLGKHVALYIASLDWSEVIDKVIGHDHVVEVTCRNMIAAFEVYERLWGVPYIGGSQSLSDIAIT